MILLIDNYDSFSYNLFQFVGSINPDIKVIRNDEMSINKIEESAPSHIIISPGPGRPGNAGICEEAIDYFKGKIPILGVCLGHQAICEAFGGKIVYAEKLMHGKQSTVVADENCRLFASMPKSFKVARYHSLAVDRNTLPECLKIISQTDDGEIMAVKHKSYDIYGVQFHPESILTENGMQILNNFINIH